MRPIYQTGHSYASADACEVLIARARSMTFIPFIMVRGKSRPVNLHAEKTEGDVFSRQHFSSVAVDKGCGGR